MLSRPHSCQRENGFSALALKNLSRSASQEPRRLILDLVAQERQRVHCHCPIWRDNLVSLLGSGTARLWPSRLQQSSCFFQCFPYFFDKNRSHMGSKCLHRHHLIDIILNKQMMQPSSLLYRWRNRGPRGLRRHAKISHSPVMTPRLLDSERNAEANTEQKRLRCLPPPSFPLPHPCPGHTQRPYAGASAGL